MSVNETVRKRSLGHLLATNTLSALLSSVKPFLLENANISTRNSVFRAADRHEISASRQLLALMHRVAHPSCRHSKQPVFKFNQGKRLVQGVLLKRPQCLGAVLRFYMTSEISLLMNGYLSQHHQGIRDRRKCTDIHVAAKDLEMDVRLPNRAWLRTKQSFTTGFMTGFQASTP